MTRKRKRRSGIVEIGNGPARVKIYTMSRKDGYPEFTLSWKEAGKRKIRSFASMEEARMIAQQTSVRLTNGWTAGDEVTRRDIDLLRHCEQVAKEHEWITQQSTKAAYQQGIQAHQGSIKARQGKAA